MKFGIFIYPGVEPIDLATFGVLSMARRIAPEIDVTTIAPQAGPVALASGLVVHAAHGIDDAPTVDWLIVTGGPGWVAQSSDERTLRYLRTFAAGPGKLASVCTGAMILAAAGVLDGRDATTKCEVVPPEVAPLSVMRERHPTVRVHEASIVDTGGIVTGGGVALCIDTMLHILARVLGPAVASETARIMEYERALAANAREYPIFTG